MNAEMDTRLLLLREIEGARQKQLGKLALQAQHELRAAEQLVRGGERMAAALQSSIPWPLLTNDADIHSKRNCHTNAMRLQQHTAELRRAQEKVSAFKNNNIKPLMAALRTSDQRLKAIDRQRHCDSCKILRSVAAIEERELGELQSLGAN